MRTYSNTKQMLLGLSNILYKANSMRDKLEVGLKLDESEEEYIIDRIESAKDELYDVACSYFDEVNLDALKKDKAGSGSPA